MKTGTNTNTNLLKDFHTNFSKINVTTTGILCKAPYSEKLVNLLTALGVEFTKDDDGFLCGSQYFYGMKFNFYVQG